MYRADGMSPADARRAARDVMRRPDVALAVHARAELGVDPERLAVAVAGRRLLDRRLPRRRPAARDPVAVPDVGHGADAGIRRRSASSPRPFVGVAIGRLADPPVVRTALRQVVDRASWRARVTYAIGSSSASACEARAGPTTAPAAASGVGRAP